MNKLNKVNNAYAVIRHVTAPYLNDLLQELSVELGQPLGLPGPAARPAAKKEWMPTDRIVPRLVSEDPLKEEKEMEEKRQRARAAAERRLEEGKKLKKQEEDAAVRIQSIARMNAAKNKLKARRKEREHEDFQKLIEEEGTESSESGRAAEAEQAGARASCEVLKEYPQRVFDVGEKFRYETYTGFRTGIVVKKGFGPFDDQYRVKIDGEPDQWMRKSGCWPDSSHGMGEQATAPLLPLARARRSSLP